MLDTFDTDMEVATTSAAAADSAAVGIAVSAYARLSGQLMTLIDELRKSGAALDVPLPRIVVIGESITEASARSASH